MSSILIEVDDTATISFAKSPTFPRSNHLTPTVPHPALSSSSLKVLSVYSVLALVTDSKC